MAKTATMMFYKAAYKAACILGYQTYLRWKKRRADKVSLQEQRTKLKGIFAKLLDEYPDLTAVEAMVLQAEALAESGLIDEETLRAREAFDKVRKFEKRRRKISYKKKKSRKKAHKKKVAKKKDPKKGGRKKSSKKANAKKGTTGKKGASKRRKKTKIA